MALSQRVVWSASALFFLPQVLSAQGNECTSLPIQKPKDGPGLAPEFSDIYDNLAEFQEAFQKDSYQTFKKLLHPSIHRSEEQKKEVFNGTVYEYGLKNVKLTLTSLWQLKIKNSTNPVAKCPLGEARGVVGSENQIIAMHSYLGGEEQIRLYTIYIPIPRSMAESKKLTKQSALVHLHAQTWTYEKKAPDNLLEEARKFNEPKDAMTAWFVAEAARRLLAANPYFEPTELAGATKTAAELRQRAGSIEGAKAAVAATGTGWSFVDYTVTFGGKGLEAGVKLRTKEEQALKAQSEDCEKNLKALAKLAPESMRKRFPGMHCLPYRQEENLDNPPAGGTQFFTWKQLGI